MHNQINDIAVAIAAGSCVQQHSYREKDSSYYNKLDSFSINSSLPRKKKSTEDMVFPLTQIHMYILVT